MSRRRARRCAGASRKSAGSRGGCGPEALDDLGLASALAALTNDVARRTRSASSGALAPDLPVLSAGRGARRLPRRPGGAHERGAARRERAVRGSRFAPSTERSSSRSATTARLRHGDGGGGRGASRHARARSARSARSRRRAASRVRDDGPPSAHAAMTAHHPARLLLADDHAMVRRGLRLVLDAEPDLRVVAEAGDGIEALEQARERRLRPRDPRRVDAADDRAAGGRRARAAAARTCAC